jgi:hypothetical protein
MIPALTIASISATVQMRLGMPSAACVVAGCRLSEWTKRSFMAGP